MANKTITFLLKTISDFSDVERGIDSFQKDLSQLKLPAKFKDNFKNIFNELTIETKNYQKFLDSGFKKKSDITGLESSGKKISSLLKQLKKEFNNIPEDVLAKSVNSEALNQARKDAENLANQISNIKIHPKLTSELKNVENALFGVSKFSKTKIEKINKCSKNKCIYSIINFYTYYVICGS